MRSVFLVAIAFLTLAPQDSPRAVVPPAQSDTPFLTSELLFPLEHWHNHASMIVELPDGDLLTCWFHGSGERTGRRCDGARRTDEEGGHSLERTVRSGRHDRLPRYERDHVSGCEGAPVADVADHPRQQMAHRTE